MKINYFAVGGILFGAIVICTVVLDRLGIIPEPTSGLIIIFSGAAATFCGLALAFQRDARKNGPAATTKRSARRRE